VTNQSNFHHRVLSASERIWKQCSCSCSRLNKLY